MGLFSEEDNSMSFMDRLNQTADERQKKNAVAPKVGVAQNAVTNHSYTQGKSRVQGGQGAGQASQGWKSQYTGAGDSYKKQINPIINSLSNSNVGYKMPKITKSLLSNEGFNQALGVIGAKNNAKLKMQNRRVQQGMLGSLLHAESQNNALSNRSDIAGMKDETDRRGQDMTSTDRVNTLKETANRNTALGKYYDGQTAIGEERNRIAKYKAENPTAKEINPLDDMKKRQFIVNTDGGLEKLLGADLYATFNEEQIKGIEGEYMRTGNFPKGTREEAYTNWYGGDSTRTVPDYSEQEQPQAPTAQPQQEAFKLDTKQGNALLGAIAEDMNVSLSDVKFDGSGNVLLPNGKLIDTQKAWGIMNG